RHPPARRPGARAREHAGRQPARRGQHREHDRRRGGGAARRRDRLAAARAHRRAGDARHARDRRRLARARAARPGAGARARAVVRRRARAVRLTAPPRGGYPRRGGVASMSEPSAPAAARRWPRRLAIAAGVVLALAVLVRALLPTAIERGAAWAGPRYLGLPVRIANVDIGLLRGQVTIEGLAIGNRADAVLPAWQPPAAPDAPEKAA